MPTSLKGDGVGLVLGFGVGLVLGFLMWWVVEGVVLSLLAMEIHARRVLSCVRSRPC